ncbi:MAG TPA: ABC transporter permease [Pseudolabrys sp.]|nr:ABC transporter permease [Pseudolabrys sp.]
MTALGWLLGRLLVIVCFLVFWELAIRAGWVDPFFFSSPGEIGQVLSRWYHEGRIFGNLALTLSEAALGYAIGVTAGTTLGFAFAFLPRVAMVFDPFIAMLNAFPRLTLAPLFIVWFGFGIAPKVALVALFIVFICFFNTYRGFKEIDPELLDRARLWGASRWQIGRHIYLPAAVTWIIAGLRASVGFALIGAVIGEYIGGDAGVGFLIMQGQYLLRMREVLAGLVLLLIVAAIIDVSLRMIEARSSKWRPAPAAR